MCECGGRGGVIIHEIDEQHLIEYGGWDGIEYCSCPAGREEERKYHEWYANARLEIYGPCGHGRECLCWDVDDSSWEEE